MEHSLQESREANTSRYELHTPTPRFFELLLRIFPQIIDYSVYFFSRRKIALRINWIYFIEEIKKKSYLFERLFT